MRHDPRPAGTRSRPNSGPGPDPEPDPAPPPQPLPRATVRALTASPIRQLANTAMHRADVLPFWFGESDGPTVASSASRQPVAGAGRNPLWREPGPALSAPRLVPLPERAARRGHRHGTHRRQRIRGIGHHAGRAAAARAGRPRRRHHSALAQPDRDSSHPRRPHPALPAVGNGRPMDAGRAGCCRRSGPAPACCCSIPPNNPTGWTIEAEDIAPILRHCRRHGIWILCDDVYERLLYDPALASAPSSSGTARPMTASSRSTVSPGLVHDRMARRLDGRARVTDGRSGQADRIQQFLRLRSRAAGGDGGPGARRGHGGGAARSWREPARC